jgi:hypothetical protein
MRPGRYYIRLSRVFTSAASWSRLCLLPGHLPVTGPGLDQVSGRQPDPLTPSPLLSGQPSAIGIPHPYGIARPTTAVTTPRNPHP